MLYLDVPVLVPLAGNLALCRDADDVKLHRVPLKVMLAQVPPLDALTQYAWMGDSVTQQQLGRSCLLTHCPCVQRC